MMLKKHWSGRSVEQRGSLDKNLEVTNIYMDVDEIPGAKA